MASYDSTSPSTEKSVEVEDAAGGSKQGLLDDLPSTAMWLLNKVSRTRSFVSTLLMICSTDTERGQRQQGLFIL